MIVNSSEWNLANRLEVWQLKGGIVIDNNEVEWFGFISMLLGAVIVVLLCFWDNIAGVTIRHSEGLGWMQILAIVVSGLYTFWAYTVNLKWREYRKEIRTIGIK